MENETNTPSKPNLLTWVRRLFVWSLTIGVVAWAGVASYRVLFRHETPNAGNDLQTVMPKELPESTGEYKYEDARKMLKVGRELLRAGDINGGLSAMQLIVTEHSDSPQVKDALLVLGSTYQYIKHDNDKAIRYYTQFVRDYPDDREVPAVIGYLRQIAKETNTPDRTDSLINSILPRLENNPKALERVQKLIKK